MIVLSRHSKEYYTQWFKNDKILYAYNTRIIDSKLDLSSQERLELLDFKGDSVLLGANCALLYRKGIDMIIQALPYLNNYKLFVVGHGTEKENLQKLAKDLNVANRVFFAGFKLNAYRYLRYYDIYVMPSRSEGFPLSLLEAASVGKNIVCSEIPAFKEFFSFDEILMFTLDDRISLIDSIKKVTNNTKMQENVKQRFIRDYSPECAYNRYVHLYAKAINEKNPK
ncbi:hypothetical protein FACS1894181_18320 [Bacteroidia bacterium]|nr:hypothetical protein FACS1894181_18320 [Bacteroidia bacterium]